jgi:CHAT domain-containing protein
MTAFGAENGGTGDSFHCAALLKEGRFRECAELAERSLKEVSAPADEMALRLAKTRALAELERYPEAFAELERLRKLARNDADPALEGEMENLSGALFLAEGELDEAERSFRGAVETGRATNSPALLARGLNNSAILQLRRNNPAAALPLIKEGVSIAEKSRDPESAAKSYVTCANALLDLGDTDSALQNIAIAHSRHIALPASYDRAKGLLVIGDWYEQLAERSSAGSAVILREKARSAYLDALEAASALNEQRIAGYAAGGAGRVEEINGNFADALKYTRMAMFSAQRWGYQDILYLWQWQAARILRAQGLRDDAIRLNLVAVQTLQSVRHNFARNEVDYFQKQIKPVYLDLADMLLARASLQKERESGQETLAEVLRTVELLRSDEMKEYLRDSCAGSGRSELTGRKLAEMHVAVIYYIVFRDRIEALLASVAGLQRFTVAAPVAEISAAVQSFRDSLEKRDAGYLAYGKKLYEWLIAPLEPFLKDTETLVFVSDGVIRMVPMAALHDGKQYLIEKHAVALTQGLTITEGSGRISYNDIELFLGGITRGVNGTQEIPYVNEELGRIHQLYRGAMLKDEAFTVPSIDRELRDNPYPVLHIASHGQFGGDVANTFILTWDGRIDIDKLAGFVRMSRYRREPLDLLTLSACSTAAGDERASLGLAGVALKAGAKSAVASLWDVDDQATSRFFISFYRILKDEPALSKAGAMRKAQLSMLHDGDPHEASASTRGLNRGKRGVVISPKTGPGEAPAAYSHPYYWAPFVLTGNWF